MEANRKRTRAPAMKDGSTFLFVDRIDVWVVWKILCHRKSLSRIYYFDSDLERALDVLRQTRLLSAEICQIRQNISVHRDEAGVARFVSRWHDCIAICERISQRNLMVSPHLNRMSRFWELDHVVLYFERKAEKALLKECLRIGLIRDAFGEAPRDVKFVLLLRSSPWLRFLQGYGRRHGIRLCEYGLAHNDARKLLNLGWSVWMWLGRVLRNLKLSAAASPGRHQHVPGQSVPSCAKSASIALRYHHRALSLDPNVRSEFFWLAESGIPYAQVLLYDYACTEPIDKELQEELRRRGIRILGHGPGVEVWKPTRLYWSVLFRTTLRVLIGSFASVVSFRRASTVFLVGLLGLARDYAYWYDFFLSNRVTVNVTNYANGSVGQSLSIHALGGIDAAYQYSASNLAFPSSHFRGSEDIAFVFSSLFGRKCGWGQSLKGRFIETGFIYGGALPSLRTAGTFRETRETLRRRGAEYIVCFFDENSNDRWDVTASNEGAAAGYTILLEWLIDDPTLGLVIKPKQWKSLFGRLASISELIKKAEATGRCVFLRSDSLIGHVYPAEAALAADIAVGLLGADTAALEARLAGVPTLLVDAFGLRDRHPYYRRGHGRVVFDDLGAVRSAVEQNRSTPQSLSDLGEWSPWLDDLDPFQDDKGAHRMGSFIGWASQALATNASRIDALAQAEEKFAREWGEDHIHVC